MIRIAQWGFVGLLDVERALETEAVQLFAVGVEDARYPRNWSLLEGLARSTGGEFFKTQVSRARLRNVFHKIAMELAGQYVLAFSPSREAVSGQFREIEILVLRSGTTAKHRTRYVLR